MSDISSTKTIKHENKHESHLELTTSAQVFSSIENIQYVDYKNIKKDSQTIISKKLSKKLVAKSFIFSTCFIAILLTLNLITNHTGTSALYFTFWITGLLFAIFYPVILTLNLQNHIDKLYKTNLKAIHKKILFTNLCLTLLVIIVVLVANIVNGVTNISSIVHFNNFENFYAPIILISSSLLDGILFKIMFKK